jgi:hypothetical protein
MAVTYDGIKPGSMQATNSRGIRTYSVVHRLIASSQTDGPYTVGSNASLPRIGSQWYEDPGAFCISLQVVNSNPWKGWEVTASYDSTFEVSENPLLDRADIQWDGENFEEFLLKDVNGEAVLNSAGDPFEDSMRERTRRVVTITKNVLQVPDWIIDSEDAVNSSAFDLDGITIPAKKAKLGAPRIGGRQTRNGVPFRVLTMVIKLNKDGWNYQPLDQGYRSRHGSGDVVRCTSAGDGTDTTRRAPLDGAGGILSDPTPATAVYLDYDVYPAYDFNLLPLT